ncbi:hypothetical protein FN846DRAFT_889188 [Sphaerosporella brunnea]|uniref:Uncharacterized protein n=1 Tax=Sphaerosporella brunnea TaxID=1250544 RepID=A0A5J5F0D0_9PEZI|nr:hypothetical protein FN846DRAFT_889188 [Sphaerosporella brunnea]
MAQCRWSPPVTRCQRSGMSVNHNTGSPNGSTSLAIDGSCDHELSIKDIPKCWITEYGGYSYKHASLASTRSAFTLCQDFNTKEALVIGSLDQSDNHPDLEYIGPDEPPQQQPQPQSAAEPQLRNQRESPLGMFRLGLMSMEQARQNQLSRLEISTHSPQPSIIEASTSNHKVYSAAWAADRVTFSLD